MIPAYFTPPPDFTEAFTDGSEWIYNAHKGRNYVRVVGVMYDQGSDGHPAPRDQDKILTVNVTVRGGYDGDSQYRTGKMMARTRYDMGRNYSVRPALAWAKGTAYQTIQGDGRGRRVWTAVHVYADGSALLVPADGRAEADHKSADERAYWRESDWIPQDDEVPDDVDDDSPDLV